MTIRHASKLTRAQRRDLNKKSRQLRQTKQRRMRYEPLEARQLLAADVVPQLVGIQPNSGELLQENDVRGLSPRSLTFNFAEVNDAADLIDPATLDAGIVISRAGLDGKLGTADDVRITGLGANFEGFIGIGDQPNQVVVRFGEALPDDLYRIEITSDLTDMEGQAATAFTRNFELNLAPQVMSVVPQPVTRNQDTGVLEIASDMIYVYFNDDDLDPELASNPDYYQLTFQGAQSDNGTPTNSDLGLGNDSQSFYPDSVVYDPINDVAMLKFSAALEDLVAMNGGNDGFATVFRLQVGVRGIASKGAQILDTTTLDGGTDAGSSFETAFNLTSLNTSVDLQSADGLENYAPGTNLFAGNNEFRVTRGADDLNNDGEIDVNHTTFTIDDGLGNLRTFELVASGSAAAGNIPIDISGLGTSTTELAAAIRSAIVNEASANFAVSASTVTGFSPDRSQLRGTMNNRVSMTLGNKGTGLIVDRTQALVIRGEIQNTFSYDIALPGGNDEPGHRDVELDGENHLQDGDQDGTGVSYYTYNFPEIYGYDPTTVTTDLEDGEAFYNQITEAQKQRTREIFEIYSFYSGIEFIEVPSNVAASIGVVTGDLRGISPGAITGPGGVAGLAGQSFYLDIPLAIMETADHDNPGDDEVGAAWQHTAFHEIGHLLGLTHTYDLPIGTIMGSDNENLDFGQNVENLLPGDFDVTHLRHLHRPDVIDIDMYRFDITETGTLSAEVVAERLNDSSRLDATLTLYRLNGDGTYTAIARNNDYFSEDSFLEMSLEPGTYYIGISASGNNVYDPNVEDSGFGGTSEGEYELQLRFTPTTNDSIRDTGSSVTQVNTIVVQGDGSDFADGATITLRDGTQTRVFEFDNNGTLNDPTHEAVSILPTSLQSEIVAALVSAINGANFDVSATASGNKISLSNLAVNNPITLDPLIIQSQAVVVTKGAASGAALDGDLDGIAGGNFNFWFRAEPTAGPNLSSTTPRTLFVDATYTGVSQTGSLSTPYKTIGAAITAAKNAGRGDVIRVIGLPGIDDDEDTLGDNIAYLIGRDPLNNSVLRDGSDLVIPKGVTLMIDEGAIIKFNNASIQVGSTSVTDDRSFAALQILGIPERYQPQVDENGAIIDGTQDEARANRRVTLTSYRETTLLNDDAGDKVGNASFLQGDASPGNWGGILFNQEVDREQLRGNYADAGIFLNSVIGAEIRYAGGITVIDGSNVSLAPIYLEEARPTLNYNVIRYSAGAAVSADPNSFEESYYTVYKGETAAYTPDVRRIGPDIFGNRIVNNSTNGLLVRIPSTPGQPLEEMTVAGRFDDTDIVYVIQEALHVNSTPGGATSDMMTAIKVPHLSGIAEDDVLYVDAFDENGTQRRLAIQFTKGAPNNLALAASQVLYIDLEGDLALNFTESRLAELIADRIIEFRNTQAFAGFFLDIDPTVKNSIVALTGNFGATFNGAGNGILVEQAYEARLDGSLVVDPNVVVKFNAGRIEVEMGANFIAEGAPGRPVVFTSLQDDRYGFGGTFDTNNNGDQTAPAAGDWSGIYFAHTSSGSIDRALIAYGGGESSVAGGQADFNAVEIHQAVVRVTNSTFEYNANGVDNDGDNAGGATRNNHMSNANAVIFMRDSQSVVVGNNFRFNEAYVLNVDTSSLSHELTVDWGRSTGNLDRQTGLGDNQGALVRRNLLTDNDLNAMVVRGGVLTTQSVWDDTDIVHVLFDTIYSTNFHTYGGIRIESSSTESLVVKLLGDEAGFEATGTQLDIDDRIGGMLHVVGQAGFPVIFTDLRDDSVGAGFDQNGRAQTDTNNAAGTPVPGSWKGLTIDQFANDRNVQVIVEAEANNLTGAGVNGMPVTAQAIGQLAADEYGGDDNRRLGFEVNGYLSNRADVDVYSFVAEPGTEVWFDIDKTSYFLDVVVELVDGDGNVLAGSTNSYDQSGDSFYGQSAMLSVTNPLQKSGFYEEDLWSNNPRDAGMRVVLPGQPGTARTYHVRVRSNGADLTSPGGNVVAGNTQGVYQLNVRLREVDELAGSSIQFADIRYAENGISIYGQPGHSPVLGESAEDQSNNDTQGAAHKLGNVLNSDRGAISVAGEISGMDGLDVDWYEFSFDFDSVQSIPGSSSGNEYGSLIIDLDYAAGLNNANTIVNVYNSDGELVYTSSGGAVNDDLISPQTPGNEGLADLSRGSNNTGDPYLGTIMLPAGTPETPITYYVAVSSEDRTSVQMEQFFRSDATNTMTRLEPVNSVRRIVEDHIGTYSTIGTAPVVPSIIDASGNNSNSNPYVLGDFVMFLSTNQDPTANELFAVDPFTGAIEAYVGRSGERYRDLAMAPDGTLYAYGIYPGNTFETDANSGHFLEIDTGDGSSTFIRDDGIITYQPNKNGDPEVTNVRNNTRYGYGYQFDATTFQNNFGEDGLRLYAVGSRGDAWNQNNSTSEWANIIFLMDASNSDGDNVPIGLPQDYVDAINAGVFASESDTNVRDVYDARIDTLIDFFAGGTNRLQTVAATGPMPQVTDGQQFQVDRDGVTGSGAATIFEIEMGNDFKLDLDPANGAFIQDGMEFVVSGSASDTIRFQTGGVFDFSGFDINNLAVGSSFTIVEGANSQRFVFDDGSIVADPNSTDILIQFDAGVDDAESIRQKMIDAINASPLAANVTADGTVAGRITVEGDQLVVVSPDAGGIAVEGSYGQTSDATTIIVNVEETWSSEEVVQAIRDAVATANAANLTDLSVSVNQDVAGDVTSNRFNFIEAGNVVVTYDSSANGFDALLDPTVTASQGVAGMGTVPVYIGAGFSAAQVAAAVEAAALNAGISADNSAGTNEVVFPTAGAGGVVTGTTPFTASSNGIASGGFVTGLAWIGNDLFAVTDTGGLFNLSAGSAFENDIVTRNDTVQADFVTQIYDDNGNAVQFQSLSAGPARVGGNTEFSDVLFGVSTNGDIYAFDENGVPQHVFQGGRSNISTGLNGVNGLQFGTLNENLWHTSGTDGNAAGHGINVPVDNSRNQSNGGSSLYFGTDQRTFASGNQWGNASTQTYDFPGDAHGSVITDPFSLYGYNSADLPTLYFTYQLDVDGQDFEYLNPDPDIPATDSLRVFIAGDDGEWHLLATNNSLRRADTGPEPDDEFDAIGAFSDAAIPEEFRSDRQNGTEGVQELFDNTGWRQARIDLGAFAGQENLRLRFDFSTGGSVNLGGRQQVAGVDVNTEELRFLSGYKVQDGGTYTVVDAISGGTTQFEFNKGQSLTFDSGARIVDGFQTAGADDFTLTLLSNPLVALNFQYVLDIDDVAVGNIPILFKASDSAETIRMLTEEAILSAFNAFPEVRIYHESDATFNIQGVRDLSPADLHAGVTVTGSNATGAFSEVIQYNSETTARELAILAQDKMNSVMSPESYAQGYQMFNRFEEFLYGNGYQFFSFDGSVGIDSALQGDDFGYAYDPRVGRPGDPDSGFRSNTNMRGQDNANRGVFIDDLIIGFAERGEMVTGSTKANNYVDNPYLRENQILTGEYQLEIRRGTDYGVPNADGSKLVLDPGWDFDTNDRLTESYTILASSGAKLGTGDRIRVGDGTDWVTFEFFDLDSVTERLKRGLSGTSTRNAYDADNNVYSIGYYNTDSPSAIATKLMNAVNDHQGQIAKSLISTTSGGLGVYAQLNARNGVTTSNRVDLSAKTTSDTVRLEYDVQSDDAFREGFDTGIDGNDINGVNGEQRNIQGTIGDNDQVDKTDGFADIDVYNFVMRAGQWVELSLAEQFSNVIGAATTLRLFLGNSTTPLVEFSGDGTQRFRADESGTYHVVISGNPIALPQTGNAAAPTLTYDATKVAKNDPSRRVKTHEGNYDLAIHVANDLDASVNPNEVDINRSFGLLAETTPQFGYAVSSDDSYGEAYNLRFDGADLLPAEAQDLEIRGVFGDNDPADRIEGRVDVDIYKFEAVAGQRIELELDRGWLPFLDTTEYFRLIDGATGQFVPGVGGPNGINHVIFNAPSTGTYYIAMSNGIDPFFGDSALSGYNLNLPGDQDPGRTVGSDVTEPENYVMSLRVFTQVFPDFANEPEKIHTAVIDRQSHTVAESSTQVITDQFGNPISFDFQPTTQIRRYDVLGESGFKLDGDKNRHRDQGQIIISSNMISNSENYGILVDAGDRQPVEDQLSANNRPHQGAPINVPSAANTQRLATGVTIENNVIYNGGTGGILYSGDSANGNDPLGAVPFGRIINNTLYGDGVGVGVRVEDAAGPTLMNNIISNFETGVEIVDATSKANTVLSRNLYQGNGANTNAGVGTGSLSIVLGANDPLFVDAANGNFYLAAGSKAIDAAVDAIQERAEVAQVVNPLGIASTPLLAPERDITGQLRVDDPNVVSGGGVGGSTFLDIGAFDRADFTGPTGYLFDPQDNDAADRDLNDLPDIVQWIGGPLTNISIQLLDEGEISNQGQGVGVDDTTVTSASVRLEIITSGDPIVLVEGVDYTFDYDSTNNIIRLLPVSGVFQEGVLFKVTLDSDPDSPNVIRDLANNPIEFNNAYDDGTGTLVGETRYLIQVGALVDYGDAPDSYGTLLGSDGARHTLVDNFYLGSGVDAEVDGQPTFDASGDGSTDDGIYIRTPDSANAGKFLDFTLRDNISNELYITATAPSGSQSFGFVDAWIDFNQDGDFDDPGEQILFSKALTIDAIDPQGSPSQLGQLITISNLPSGALEGDTIARFRYSSTGGLTPTGLASDGEVEDYKVTIGAPSVNPWHNGDNPFAVTKPDNAVTNFDLVTLLAELRSRTYTYGDVADGHVVGDFRPGYEPDSVDAGDVLAYYDVNNDRRVTNADLMLLLSRLSPTTRISPEPISGEMLTGTLDNSEPATEIVASPIEVESNEVVTSIIPATAPVSSAPTSIQSESIIESESFVALAPSYSDLQMRPAAELMGYRSSIIEDSSLIIDEAIALEDLVDDDQFSQLIGDMADDLSASWDGKQFHDDSDDEASEEDDLDELLTLISQSSSEE